MAGGFVISGLRIKDILSALTVSGLALFLASLRRKLDFKVGSTPNVGLELMTPKSRITGFTD